MPYRPLEVLSVTLCPCNATSVLSRWFHHLPTGSEIGLYVYIFIIFVHWLAEIVLRDWGSLGVAGRLTDLCFFADLLNPKRHADLVLIFFNVEHVVISSPRWNQWSGATADGSAQSFARWERPGVTAIRGLRRRTAAVPRAVPRPNQ